MGVAVYENVNRSVVNIVTKIPGTAGLLMFDNSQEGAGSGSVLDKRGNILTNYHVIEGAREIEVTLFDGSQHEARVVGRDISSDIAVLHIDAPPELLWPVYFGDSTRLKVGQRVFAIGNPFGLERTLTTGIVSSLNRTLPARNNRTIKSIIQIDAAINPGNSGGPLLDSHGRLIGMNTAIASRTGQNTGVGFAIPVSNIARVVPELIEKGHVVRPETGHRPRLSNRARPVRRHDGQRRPGRAGRPPRVPRREAAKAARAVHLSNESVDRSAGRPDHRRERRKDPHPR